MTIPGATPVMVLTTMCECGPWPWTSGTMKFLPAKRMKLPRTRILPAQESLLPFIRMLALAAIVYAALQLFYSACQIVLPYASGGRVSLGLNFSLRSPNLIVALLLEVLVDAAAVVVLIGGIGCHSLR